ncbi:hypothetical protein ACQU0X_24085 [Pseudovibrio ascidiaceicola]|uniref:hypothetical protein n=1 Tax=Pseudovibrio ascidiaceicola TaxID=285279 RepID=UPI003D35B6BB
MRVFLIVFSLFLGVLQPAWAAQKVTGIDLVFAEQAMIGKKVKLTDCTWVLGGVDGMGCNVRYKGRLLARIWADFTNEDLPSVRPLLDHCMDKNPRCQFDVEGKVKKVGKYPELENIKFEFRAD